MGSCFIKQRFDDVDKVLAISYPSHHFPKSVPIPMYNLSRCQGCPGTSSVSPLYFCQLFPLRCTDYLSTPIPSETILNLPKDKHRFSTARYSVIQECANNFPSDVCQGYRSIISGFPHCLVATLWKSVTLLSDYSFGILSSLKYCRTELWAPILSLPTHLPYTSRTGYRQDPPPFLSSVS